MMWNDNVLNFNYKFSKNFCKNIEINDKKDILFKD